MEISHSKLSFKRFELPVQRFSKTALPLYLTLLNKHQEDISKVNFAHNHLITLFLHGIFFSSSDVIKNGIRLEERH